MMAELLEQEIVTLDSIDVQEEIQVESELAPKKRRLQNKSLRFVGILKKSIEPSEIPAAIVASDLQMKVPQNGEGFRHLPTLSIFEADRFCLHLFAWPFLCG